MGDGEQGGNGCDRVRESGELFNPVWTCEERRPPNAAWPQALITEPAAKMARLLRPRLWTAPPKAPRTTGAMKSREAWRCRDEIGQRDEMDEARQPKVLLGDVKMRGRRLAQSWRKAGVVGHDQRSAAPPSRR